MTPTPHGQVPEALIDLIDAYAETRHRYGGIYNARTEAARNAVIEALSGVQALSAAPAVPAGWKAVPVNPTPEMWKAAMTVPDPNPPYPPHYGLVWDAMLAASPTPPAEQQAQPGAVDRTGCTAGTDEECTRRGCATSCPAQQAATKAVPGEQNTVPAELLEQAYREGWAACRDAETIGEEAEDWAFGNSTANSRMIDAQQAAPQQDEPVGEVVSASCDHATVRWLHQTSSVGGGDPRNSRAWPKVSGVSRDEGHSRALLVFFAAEPTDDEVRAVHDTLAASPTPPAEQQAQTGAVDRTGCTAGTEEECTRRGCATSCPAQQAAPKAAPVEQDDHQILAITTAYEQGVGKGHQAYNSGKEIANPYSPAYRCDLAWQYGYKEGKEQAQREAKAAPQQEAQEPVAWLVTWAGGVHNYVQAHASELPAVDQGRRMAGTVTPLYTAPQPAPDCHHRPPCDECAAIAAQGGE